MTPGAGRSSTPASSAPARPIDLRLLPAAAAVWVCAWAGVRSPEETVLGLAAVLGAAGFALLGILLVLRRLLRPDGSPAVVLAAQLAVCCVAGAAAAASAAWEQDRLAATGWPLAVDSEVPVVVELEVDGPSRPISQPGPDGAARAVVPVSVTAHGTAPRSDVGGADAVLLVTEEEAGPLSGAAQLRGMVRPSPTDAGDRATALLVPFGHEALAPVESREAAPHGPLAALGRAWEDLRTSVRAGLIEASSGTYGDAPELLPGLVFGDRTVQSQELSEAMRTAGMTHLTVVSGTHCALVMGALLGMLRLMRAPRPAALLGGLVGLGLYVGLVDPAPSVVRAAVMGALGALALFAGRRRVSFSLLCVCVLGMLIWDPWYSQDAAMQLSVAATAGIILTGARIQEWLGRVLPGIIAGPAALALSAQLFVVPVLLPVAGGVTTYAVPANLLASPLLPLATIPGLLGALLVPAVPPVGEGLLMLCGIPAALIGGIGRQAAELPRALASWPDGPVGAVLVCLYLATAAALAWRLLPRGGAASAESLRHGGDTGRGRDTGRRSTDRTGGWILVCLCAALAGALTALVLPGRLSGLGGAAEDWRVALCDVGQGDMLVVRSGADAAVVVDAGEEPELADTCLSRLGVRTVETLFITHEHRDHYGGVPGVLRGRVVHQLLYGGSADWRPRAEEDLRESLDAGGRDRTETRRALPGERSAGSPMLQWQVWRADQHHAAANDNSLVILFELMDPGITSTAPGGADDPMRLLATGDLEEQAARLAMITGGVPEEVDLLKVSHHGAANGGTEILDHTAPAVALIGVGEDNPYGHPDRRITEALEAQGATVYRTDLHGGVVLRLEGDRIAAERLPP